MNLSKAVAIAQVNLVRLLRDRSGLFFIFVFPLLLVLVLGLSFGGGFSPRIGVVAEDAGPLGEELVERLGGEDIGWTIERSDDARELREAVRSGRLEASLVIPPRYDDRLRAGEAVSLEYVAPAQDVSIGLRTVVEAAVADQSAVARAARFVAAQAGLAAPDAFEVASEARDAVAPIEVEVSIVGESFLPESLAGFGLGAQSQLVLFMFVTSMSAAGQLIASRLLGVSRRMVSTPTSIGTILAGEALGRLGIAMLQGIFIVAATALGFGVAWGDPLGAAAIIVAFAAVGAGAAMLVGAIASNAEQASGIGVFAGLGLAAIGGAMAPPEIFPPIMDTISRLTPHRWAIEGLRELAVGGGIVDALPQLGVLVGFAVMLLGLATWRLRVVLTR